MNVIRELLSAEEKGLTFRKNLFDLNSSDSQAKVHLFDF